jgi:thiamine pyrophosphokinase
MPAEGTSMSHTVVAVITGAAPLHPRAVAAIPPEARLIAADGGLDHALAAGLRPDVLVGDLDSVSPASMAWAEEHATVERHPSDKDLTDTELALAAAAASLPERVIVVAGEGDRLDHTLAAIGSLGAPRLVEVPTVEAWWGDTYVRVVHGPGRARLSLPPGTTVSLLALHGPCEGVSIEGTKWVLDRVALEPMSGWGVSNVAIEDPVVVSVLHGNVTVIVSGGAG